MSQSRLDEPAGTEVESEPVPGSARTPPRRRLSRTVINFWLDTGLLLVVVALAFESAVLRFVFPRATAAAGWTLWGGNYDDWSRFQFGTLCLLLLGVLVHVMLHWSWICSVAAARWPRKPGQKAGKPDDGIQTLYGVGLLIGIVNIVGLLLAAAALTIIAP